MAQATALLGTISWFRHIEAVASFEGKQNIGIPILFIGVGIALAFLAVPLGAAIALRLHQDQ
jgi:hypothetical protein